VVSAQGAKETIEVVVLPDELFHTVHVHTACCSEILDGLYRFVDTYSTTTTMGYSPGRSFTVGLLLTAYRLH